MIKLKGIINQKINEVRLTEILFYSFPLSFMIGNLLLNIHLLLFIIISLFLIKKRQLSIRFDNSYWILISFFLYFFLSTIIQFQSPGLLNEKIQSWPFKDLPIFKSFILFRFLILIFIIDTLFLNKILNLKNLFLFSLLCTSFVSFDIILQYITGFDLFGLKNYEMYNSGPFGDELIAGGYLQRFFFLSFFYFFTTIKQKKLNSSLIVLTIALHLTAILLAGNRMPMILSLFGCFLIILFVKNLRLTMTLGLIVFLSTSFLVIKNDARLKQSYMNFVNDINILRLVEFDRVLNNKKDFVVKLQTEEGNKIEWTEGIWKKHWKGIILLDGSGYNRIFRTAIAVWKEQPFFGFGLKSFRIKCWDVGPKNSDLMPGSMIPIFSCSNHPHNYYLELLSESGIIGISLMLIFFLMLLKNSFYCIKKYNRETNLEMSFLIPIIIIICIEIWPLRSTGSFFTTWNATFFWLFAGILFAEKKTKSI